MWKIRKRLFFSQCRQDEWINKHIFKNKLNGVFVDIGAHDGKSLNNTFFFEKTLHWSGICIEPMPEIFPSLQHNRNCICIQGGIAKEAGFQDFMRIYGPAEMLSGFVSKYDPKHIEIIHNELSLHGGFYVIFNIQTYKINDLLAQNNLFSIDFLSLDTEGGELEILKSIDFEKFNIHVITVENNYNDANFFHFLKRKGYQKVACLGKDEIYLFGH